MAASSIAEILNFWFVDSGRDAWFAGGKAFDDKVADQLGPLSEQAATGALDGWAETPDGAVALILLLDQVPRNLYRGSAKAFATDAKALSVASAAIDAGLDSGLTDDQRAFLYLPFEHAEDMDAQRRAVRLFAERTRDPVYLDYACRHLATIARFGRFPHRNDVLGRDSTEDERTFLQAIPSGF